MLENFEGIDPRSFFEEQKRLYGEDRRDKLEVAEFCSACQAVLSSPAGQTMIEGLKVIVGYNQTKFWSGDDYNTHAAALRDGASQAITHVLLAAKAAANQVEEKWTEKPKERQ